MLVRRRPRVPSLAAFSAASYAGQLALMRSSTSADWISSGALILGTSSTSSARRRVMSSMCDPAHEEGRQRRAKGQGCG